MRAFLPLKNLKDSLLVTSFLFSSQKGAASLIVVALLLAGITAAVYLTQTGTSFLPKAEESTPVWDCSQAIVSAGYDIEKVSKNLSKCYDKGQRAKISHCEHVNNSSGAASDTLKVTDETSKKTCIEFMKSGPLPGYTNKIYCYWDPPQCSTSSAAQPAAQVATILDSPCTDPTHIAHCQNTKNEHGTNATGKCFLLNRAANLPKCEYTLDFKPPSGAAGPCNQRDNSSCPNGCELTKIKLASDGREVQYSRCKSAGAQAPAAQRPAAAGAPAAAQSNSGQRPQSAQAPSSTKTPWDKDADGDSKLISQVFARAAKAISGSYDNAKDGIDAAKKARAAYESEFKKAYSDIFKADILKDADALAVLRRELDNVAVHAYISKEHPGMSWETAKSTGKVEAAISNLKRPEVGVISQNSQITASNASTPGSAPSGIAPQRLTIDPGAAVNCGTDLDGTQIPCYQIGVFASYDDLKATEAQASIATQRYAKSQEILTAAKDKVDEAILVAAQAKLDADKAKAEACMPK